MVAKRKAGKFTKLNLRMSPALQEKVARDAQKRSVSLNAAINTRLEASFHREQAIAEAVATSFGDQRTTAVLRSFAAVTAAYGQPDKHWLDDFETFQKVTNSWRGALTALTLVQLRLAIDRLRDAQQQSASPTELNNLRNAIANLAADKALPQHMIDDARRALEETRPEAKVSEETP